MCGYSGFAGQGDPAILKRMNDSIAHRGPDADGLWNDGQVFLGHRRLAIVDIEGNRIETVAFRSTPYSGATRQAIRTR